MSVAATTTLSSKGQVVIPEEIRVRLGLKAGVQFVVLGDGDVVIFKVLEPPALKDFDALVGRARKVAKKTGLKRADITKAVAKVRRSGRSSPAAATRASVKTSVSPIDIGVNRGFPPRRLRHIMVSHESDFRAYTARLASADRYVKFLYDISEASGLDISPQSLRTSDDIVAFASKLTGGYSEKSVRNYKSVMRKYVDMVRDRGL